MDRYMLFLALVISGGTRLLLTVKGFLPCDRKVAVNLGLQSRFMSLGCRHRRIAVLASADDDNQDDVDVVVVGAGLGGLSCAALCAKYGLKTLCVEAHSVPGGCAHSFQRFPKGADASHPFQFDSGPSLISGLSQKSTNPLRQLLDAIGVADDIEWCTYDGWIVHDTADGKSFKVTTGDDGEFEKAIEEKAGTASRKAFENFKEKMLAPRGLSEASAYVPPFALRADAAAVGSLSSYFLRLLSIGTKGALLTGPFTKCLELYDLHDPFVRKWFDYLAFALSGEDAAHTQTAPVAYMMSDLHRPNKVLDYPMGGVESLIHAIVGGLEKQGGQLRLSTRVEKFLLEDSNGKASCKGVVLEDGSEIKAKLGVVSNVPLWNMARILQDSIDSGSVETSVDDAVAKVQQQADSMYMTGSFMHLHLGIPKDGLPDDLECHHSVLNMDLDVRDEQNMVIISIPTVFDPSLAPEGYHVVHAYTAASDSFDDWLPYMDTKEESGKVGFDPNSSKASQYARRDGYEELKQTKAEALWKAVEKVIPDVRERAKCRGAITMVGTPLTHRRYNQRYRGTYGPGPAPGEAIWKLNGARTPIDGLLACGDTTFPGIGLPGVAASGTIAANSLAGIRKQRQLMRELKEMDALQ